MTRDAGRVWLHPRGRGGDPFRLSGGEVWAAMAPPGGGLAEWLAGWAEAWAEGGADGPAVAVGAVASPQRRSTPQSVVAAAAEAGGVRGRLGRIAEALGAAGLTDVRATPLAALDVSARARTGLAAALAAEADVLVLDGVLDSLDPWSLEPAWAALADRAAAGAAVVVGTARADLAERAGRLAVLIRGRPAFAGDPDDLRDVDCRVTVETDAPAAVRSLLDPLEGDVREVPGGLEFRPRSAADATASLMRAGWGSVRAWVVHRPTLAEALASRFSTG